MYNILCVDDTQANLFVLESLFESKESDYEISFASSGYEALESLLEQKVDLILLDVMMPEIDGFETAKLIKQNQDTKDIPIIFLTAKRDEETIKNAFIYGVDYLSKPYDEVELLARVALHLELVQAKRVSQEQLRFTQAVLDSQHNIMFIHDLKEITSVNQRFLDYFNVDSLEDFVSQYGKIQDQFMEYNGYFSLNTLDDEHSWVQTIASQRENRYQVLLMNHQTFEPQSFVIDVSPIKDTKQFVITLTNITSITIQSKNLENKATHDELTGVFNRVKFNESLQEHFSLFQRYNQEFCFAIFDIDFFKHVNDKHGHHVGDETIITFAKAIEKKIRVTDIFARWGGEEFVLLMPNTNLEDGIKVADSLRETIANTKFPIIGHKTCSVGVTQPQEGDTIERLLIRVDEALYEAKESGRNRVCSK